MLPRWACRRCSAKLREVDTAIHPGRCKRQIDRPAELIRDYVTNCGRAVARLLGRYNNRPPGFAPFEYEGGMPMPIQRLSPPDRHAPILSGERTVFCGIRGKLMNDHCHDLT